MTEAAVEIQETKAVDPIVSLSNMIKDMMTHQHKTNIKAKGENYASMRLDWDAAIFVETGEMITSAGYKWWKHQEIDVENMKTEAVDIWHFLMSKFMCATGDASRIESFIEHFSQVYVNVFLPIARSAEEFNAIFAGSKIDGKSITHFGKQLNKRIMNGEDVQVLLLSFVEILASLQMSFEEFYKRYMIKNALNDLRQAYGYAEGTYNKQWAHNDFPEQLMEDNSVALYVVMNSTSTSYDEIYSLLETHYNAMTDIGNGSSETDSE